MDYTEKEIELLTSALKRNPNDSIKSMTELIQDEKERRVYEVCKFNLPSNTDKNGYWRINVTINEKRRAVRGKTIEKLISNLYDLLFSEPVITLKILFDEWMKYRHTKNITPSTMKRNITEWNSYIANNKIASIPMKKLTTRIMEDYLDSSIKKHSLTLKEYRNLKSLLNNLIGYSIREEIIKYDPIRYASPNLSACRTPQVVSPKEKIYELNEAKVLLSHVKNNVSMNIEPSKSISPILSFNTGVRLGELSTLKNEDIDFKNNTLRICRTETYIEIAPNVFRRGVVDNIKKNGKKGKRLVPLTPEAKHYINKLIEINTINGFSDDTYLFQNANGRLTSNTLDKALRRFCRQCNLSEKSTHDIRRTYATVLSKNGYKTKKISRLLGHSNTSITKKYIVNLKKKSQDDSKVISALSAFTSTEKAS